MSDIGATPEREILRELAGSRVLISGLSAARGVDVARTFADLGARLVLQTASLSPEVTELVALLSQCAGDLELYEHDIGDGDAAVSFARSATQAFGGIDVVINLSEISTREIDVISDDAGAELLVNAKLRPMAQLTGVTANRMRLVRNEGLILNVLAMPPSRDGRDLAVATLARAALAAMTVEEARQWGPAGIRINGIGPRAVAERTAALGACLTSEPDLAALALYLASRRGSRLSGHVFDAEGAASQA